MATKPTKPFRNEHNQRYTKQLFYETMRDLPLEERVIEPVFSLYFDREGLVNFGKEYIKDADPSGYTTAIRLLGDYGHWNHLLKAKWFRDAVETWNEELDAKLYSEGMAKIRELAKSDEKSALAAARFLATQGYKDKTATKRGRPSKIEVQGALKQAREEAEGLEEDGKRIGLVG